MYLIKSLTTLLKYNSKELQEHGGYLPKHAFLDWNGQWAQKEDFYLMKMYI